MYIYMYIIYYIYIHTYIHICTYIYTYIQGIQFSSVTKIIIFSTKSC